MKKLVIWTLLDTGLRSSELANLKRDNIEWQSHRLRVHGKGGPYGTRSKRRVLPMSPRIRPLLEAHFSLHDEFGVTRRTVQRIVKRVANRARISRLHDNRDRVFSRSTLGPQDKGLPAARSGHPF